MGASAVDVLVAKEAIRELGQLYARGIDRQDLELLRDLYTDDATHTHGAEYDGPVDGFIAFLARQLPGLGGTGFHACNHLIEVDLDRGAAQGELYGIGSHVAPDGDGGWVDASVHVRYLDHYRHGPDHRWRIASRVATIDLTVVQPLPGLAIAATPPDADASYRHLDGALFRRGARTDA